MSISFAFDDTADDAAAAAEKIAAKLITDITDETEKNIRQLIAMAIREGIPPYDAARLIHGMIGLTSAQGQAAMKYRLELINSGLAIAKVDKEVAKYADDLLTSRADSIARTEIMGALNDGQNAAWQQAQDDGVLSPDATKEMILSENACPECEDAAAEGPIPIGDDFGDGGLPIHPRCRCTEGISTP